MSENIYNPIYGIHPEFIGSSTVLNNGKTPNTLHVGLTNNNLFGAANPSETDIKIDPTTKICFWFVVDSKQASSKDPDREWALTSYGHFHSPDVKVHIILPDGKDDTTNWNINRNQPSGNPISLYSSLDGWQLSPKSNITLHKGQTIQVQISGLITGLPDGPSVAYFQLTSPKGKANTTFGPIQKTPHVLRGDKVGIGTNAPGVSLDVRGGVRARGGMPGPNGTSNNGYFFNPPGDPDSGMSSSAQGQVEFYVNSREAMRIQDKSGIKVGIGTNNPLVPLQIGDKVGDPDNFTFHNINKQPLLWVSQNELSDSEKDLGTPCLDLRNSNKTDGTGSMLSFSGIGVNDAGLAMAAIKSIFKHGKHGDVGGDLAFFLRERDTNQFNERLRVTSEGNVGIGTTTPGATLEVNGDVKVNGSISGTLIQFSKKVQLATSSDGSIDKEVDLTKHGVPTTATAVILECAGGTGNNATFNAYSTDHANKADWAYTVLDIQAGSLKGDSYASNQGTYPVKDGKIYLNSGGGWYSWTLSLVGWYGASS